MSLSDLLALPVPSIREVEIEGKKFYLTSMTGGSRERTQEFWQKGRSPMAHVIASCLCDAEGKLLDPQGNKAADVKKVPAVYLEKLFDVALNVSGLGDEEPEKNPTAGNGSS